MWFVVFLVFKGIGLFLILLRTEEYFSTADINLITSTSVSF